MRGTQRAFHETLVIGKRFAAYVDVFRLGIFLVQRKSLEKIDMLPRSYARTPSVGRGAERAGLARLTATTAAMTDRTRSIAASLLGGCGLLRQIASAAKRAARAGCKRNRNRP